MLENSFTDYLAQAVQEIDEALNNTLDEMSGNFTNASPKLAPLFDAFADGCTGGKRIRGALVKLGYELTGSPYTPEILKAAVAFELFQTSILAHDDIIDKSLLRRGKPAMHCALGGDHRGVSHAICLGDVGYFWAFKLIAESQFPSERKNRAVSSFAQTTFETGVGEILDVELPYLTDESCETDILSICALKTARYTVTGPLHLGAILGGASDDYLRKLTIFGHNLGIAFQIQDDILGIFGDEEVMGKSASSDIEEGKRTLLSHYAAQNASVPDQNFLTSIYGGGTPIAVEEAHTIQQIFRETGALNYAQSQAKAYADRARAEIIDLTHDDAKVEMLNEVANYMTDRKK